jgi:superkiller protein 3
MPRRRALSDAMLVDASLHSSDRFAALMLRARAFEMLRDLPRAIVDVDGALALDPSNARAWNELGILCADAGRGDRAIDAFAHATRADPRYARGWNNLGNALRDAGRWAESLAAFERAATADAEYALAWANLGAMQRLTGNDVGARSALRRALALDPGARGHDDARGLLHDRSDLARADLFLRAARLDAKDATACMRARADARRARRSRGAREAFAEAERRDPRMLRARSAAHSCCRWSPRARTRSSRRGARTARPRRARA